jgi:predicted nucleotidyltransferase
VTDYERLLRGLDASGVEFIIVGGFAAILHGSARLTEDLDVVYARSTDNIKRLAGALSPLHPYLRGAPPGLPFLWDAETIRRGLNFTLITDRGDLDLLGEIAGGGTYETLLPDSMLVEIFGVKCRILNLKSLIQTKRAAGRPKDFDALAELEQMLEQEE